MYQVPLICVLKLTHITLKRDSSDLRIFLSGSACWGVPPSTGLHFRCPRRQDLSLLKRDPPGEGGDILRNKPHDTGERFSESQEIWTEDNYSNPLWGIALHARPLPSHEIFHIHGDQGFLIWPLDGTVIQGMENSPIAPRDLCSFKHEPGAKQWTRREVHA